MLLRHFKTALAVLLTMASVSPLHAAQVLPDSVVVWGPVLGLTDGRAFVALDTNCPVLARIEVNGKSLKSADHNPGYYKEIPLPTRLKGRFTYQLTLIAANRRELVLGPYDARLPGEPGRSLQFVVYGDTKGEDSVHYKIVRRILESDPDFVLNTGDLVDNGNNWDDWLEFRRTTGDLLARRIYIPCLGNHDRRSVNYFKLFHLPRNEAWFEWKCRQLRLIVLDSTLPSDQQVWQTRWFEDILSVPKPPYSVTLVMFHHPPVGSGRHQPWAYGLEHWVPLITSAPVDIIFLGHNHLYQRIEYQGKPYIVTGGGGSTLDEEPRDDPESVLLRSTYHFVEVRCEGGKLYGRAVDVEGSTIDTWEYPIKIPPYDSRGE